MISDLGVWRTPVEPAPRLARWLGLNPGDLWIKRDDWLGHGGGGNKLRKLEHLCGEAVTAGATTIVTTGAAQSNYARLTAASARRLGLDVVLCLRAGSGTGNLTLDAVFGATVVWDGDPEAIAAEIPGAAVLPYGGSGLKAAVDDGDIKPGEKTVFVDTGGLPGLFGHPYAAELARSTAPMDRPAGA